LKSENETIPLTNSNLPIGNRIKIGTFKIDNTIRNLRLGEGMLGIALWKWQKDDSIEIYTTVFEKHNELINLLERFGFLNVGVNSRGERIYLKTKKKIDFSEAYKSFPFIGKSVFQNCRLIPIEQEYHDQLFPYSELANNKYDVESITAGNGITKIYIATPSSTLDFHKGDQAFIYRKSNIPPKKYKSVITSFCTISKIIQIKIN
jgi:hypothetical protein